MNPDWIPPRLRAPLGVACCLIAIGLVVTALFLAFERRQLVSGGFIIMMSGGWAWYGIWFWQHRPHR